jgi:hypothetical protein|tara:strand:+ start:67 stop:357 length:291 start_codon:yes stop_codon:yes gene_type:complete
MKTIKIKIKGFNKILPLTFSNKANVKKQLKCLLSQMPKESKQEAKDKWRWNIFCGMVWTINESIMCDALTSSMFPNITFLPNVKKPILQLPSFRRK